MCGRKEYSVVLYEEWVRVGVYKRSRVDRVAGTRLFAVRFIRNGFDTLEPGVG